MVGTIMKNLVSIALVFLLLVASPLVSAVVIQSVHAPALAPGKESSVVVTIKNTLDEDVEDLSFGFVLSGTSFIAVGGSEESTDELRDGRDEDFSFIIKPSYDVKPGDYQLPYEISYILNGERTVRKGAIGVHVGGSPELRATVEPVSAVVGGKDTLTLKIINDGLADARFVSVSVASEGMTLLSDEEVYIGTVDSDDFETATFDVLYTRERSTLVATVSYRDLDNQRQTEEIRLPVRAYTREEAIERGIITQSYIPFYVGAVVLIIVIWIVWRMIRKRRKSRLSAAS